MRGSAFLLSLMCFIILLNPNTSQNREKKGGKIMKMILTSPAFQPGGMIPPKYTCDGNDVSPALAWSGIPDGTRSIAIICDDPDAPGGDWVHWVIFNIPPDATGLPEAQSEGRNPGGNLRQGINDFGNPGYGGPCPPGGVHRYYFKIYALDTFIDQPGGCTKKQLLAAMKDHVIAAGELMGRYTRRK